jgi:hypothetical protein
MAIRRRSLFILSYVIIIRQSWRNNNLAFGSLGHGPQEKTKYETEVDR